MRTPDSRLFWSINCDNAGWNRKNLRLLHCCEIGLGAGLTFIYPRHQGPDAQRQTLFSPYRTLTLDTGDVSQRGEERRFPACDSCQRNGYDRAHDSRRWSTSSTSAFTVSFDGYQMSFFITSRHSSTSSSCLADTRTFRFRWARSRTELVELRQRIRPTSEQPQTSQEHGLRCSRRTVNKTGF